MAFKVICDCCNSMIVGFNYAGFGFTSVDRLKVILGCIGFACDVSNGLENKDFGSFYGMESAYAQLKKMGYIKY